LLWIFIGGVKEKVESLERAFQTPQPTASNGPELVAVSIGRIGLLPEEFLPLSAGVSSETTSVCGEGPESGGFVGELQYPSLNSDVCWNLISHWRWNFGSTPGENEKTNED
jgi:hypothetical protein